MVETEQKINTEKVPKKKNTSKDKPANGILKRSERRAHTIKGSERIMKSSNSITWDNKAINEQINYRKNALVTTRLDCKRYRNIYSIIN